MRRLIVALLLMLPVAASAQTINSSKINTYGLLNTDPPAASIGSTKIVTYVILDNSPAIGMTKLNSYMIITTPTPAAAQIVPAFGGPFSHP